MRPRRPSFATALAGPLLAGLLALIVSPVAAHAENPFGSCPAPPRTPLEAELNLHSAWEEACAEEATREAAEHAPATLLEVKVRSHRGTSYSEPGHTDIAIKATPFARVTFTGDHGTKTMHFQAGVENEATGGVPDGVRIRWSCRSPGPTTIHYTVIAQGGSGPPLTRTGTFTITLSARWCVFAKRREHREHATEATEEAHHRAEERKEAAEQAHREQEAQRHELEQWEGNCRKLGGTVVRLHVGSHGATVPVCRGPSGGTIEVPA
jgi:hypothetical protein